MAASLRLLVALLLVLFAASPHSVLAGPKAAPPRAAAAIQAMLTPQTKIQVFEGLPHPGGERNLAEKEMKRDDLVRLDGYPFYAPAIPGDSTGDIPFALGRPEALQRWSGEKKCGGFHPDYALAWSDKGKEYRALICFTCSEVILTGGLRPLRYDLRYETRDFLRGLLKAYQRKRPAEER